MPLPLKGERDHNLSPKVMMKNKPIESGNIDVSSHKFLEHRLLLYASNRLGNRIGQFCPLVKYGELPTY